MSIFDQLASQLNQSVDNDLNDNDTVFLEIVSKTQVPFEEGQTVAELFQENEDTLGINASTITTYRKYEDGNYIVIPGDTIAEAGVTYNILTNMGDKG